MTHQSLLTVGKWTNYGWHVNRKPNSKRHVNKKPNTKWQSPTLDHRANQALTILPHNV
jgi:hypothetical protein